MVFVDWCIMCWCNGETVDHLLLHYGKANWLWSLVLRSFWDLLDLDKISCEYSFWLVELAWKAFV